MEDAAEIRAVLDDVNAAWQSLRGDDIVERIRGHVTADAVIVDAQLQRVARGREAFCRSYADFVGSTSLLKVELKEPEIDISLDIALATLAWNISYEYKGAVFSEAGYDVYALCRRDGRWRIAWRKLESRPAG